MHCVYNNVCETDKVTAFGNSYKTSVTYVQLSNKEQRNAAVRVHAVLVVDFQML